LGKRKGKKEGKIMIDTQQPEYIITEEQLRAIEKWDSRHLGKEYRSRPHTPAPDEYANQPPLGRYPPQSGSRLEFIAKTNADSLQATIDEQCKEAAHTATLAERDRILADLIKRKESQGKHDGYMGVVLDPIIQSLRQQAGEQ
jgi:hypothetical protein